MQRRRKQNRSIWKGKKGGREGRREKGREGSTVSTPEPGQRHLGQRQWVALSNAGKVPEEN